jgi:hypothetical protein
MLMDELRRIAGKDLAHAANIISTKVLPAYAEARLLGKTDSLRKTLPFHATDEGQLGPNCATGDEGWDTLCLMQTNPLFASNVIKVIVAQRLAKKNEKRM